ncbi:MAG: hypothetical protein ABIF88_01540 [archaeon]
MGRDDSLENEVNMDSLEGEREKITKGSELIDLLGNQVGISVSGFQEILKRFEGLGEPLYFFNGNDEPVSISESEIYRVLSELNDLTVRVYGTKIDYINLARNYFLWSESEQDSGTSFKLMKKGIDVVRRLPIESLDRCQLLTIVENSLSLANRLRGSREEYLGYAREYADWLRNQYGDGLCLEERKVVGVVCHTLADGGEVKLSGDEKKAYAYFAVGCLEMVVREERSCENLTLYGGALETFAGMEMFSEKTDSLRFALRVYEEAYNLQRDKKLLSKIRKLRNELSL